MQLDLIGIGECMVEFRAEPIAGRDDMMRMAWGGDVMNTLVHAGRLGLRTAFQTRVGNDRFGPWLRAAWHRAGVDLSHAPLVPGENGLYFITNDPYGERSFTYRRAGSAAAGMGPEDLDPDLIASSRVVLLSGITQAISESADRLTAAAARIARAVVYDPNYRPQLWSRRGGLESARQAFHRVAPHAAWTLPSYPADVPLISNQDLTSGRALKYFADAGSGGVAMKMGADGVLIQKDGVTHHIPVDPVAELVDSTGAGDAWNAAFLSGLHIGEDPELAARRANAYAAIVLTYPGAIPAEIAAA
ncbi:MULTISPECIES: sugar kinase [Mameliella]|uniref:Putative Fructokinase-1 n=1 Tax=Mameliella alba TaxID=561184 RepID=A0A0B3SHS8_9RHOB|nr:MULTISPECIES: sugar kinase [Mameliella]KHQ50129.1 putative Fructokinase-1 [Mameliella alba]